MWNIVVFAVNLNNFGRFCNFVSTFASNKSVELLSTIKKYSRKNCCRVKCISCSKKDIFEQLDGRRFSTTSKTIIAIMVLPPLLTIAAKINKKRFSKPRFSTSPPRDDYNTYLGFSSPLSNFVKCFFSKHRNLSFPPRDGFGKLP